MQSLLSVLKMRGFEITSVNGEKHYVSKHWVYEIKPQNEDHTLVYINRGDSYTWFVAAESYEEVVKKFES
jgi:uncharacterized protein YlzI (FlbEa/FlbD family)